MLKTSEDLNNLSALLTKLTVETVLKVKLELSRECDFGCSIGFALLVTFAAFAFSTLKL
jgi:hypothetical protein